MTLIDFLMVGFGAYVGLVVALTVVILCMDWTERWGIMLCPASCNNDCQNCARLPAEFKDQAT